MKTEADNVEKENAEKDRLIKELQSSHEAEVSELRDRLVTQNKMLSEQVAVIEHSQMRLKGSETKQVVFRIWNASWQNWKGTFTLRSSKLKASTEKTNMYYTKQHIFYHTAYHDLYVSITILSILSPLV